LKAGLRTTDDLLQKSLQNCSPADEPPMRALDLVHNGIRVLLHFLGQDGTHVLILSDDDAHHLACQRSLVAIACEAVAFIQSLADAVVINKARSALAQAEDH
jgi:hypothetical protein